MFKAPYKNSSNGCTKDGNAPSRHCTTSILNNSGENGPPCLVPDLRAKTFSFSPSNKVLTVGLSYTALIVLW